MERFETLYTAHEEWDVEVFSFGAMIRDTWILKHFSPIYFGRMVSKAKERIVN